MKSEWTDERRQQQAATIRKNEPWKRSTGPKTNEGKAKVAQNSLKHGLRGGILRQAADFLAQQNKLLMELEK